MRKILSAVVVAAFVAALGGGLAEAKDMTNMKGLGWFDQNAPLGGILWFSPKIGVTAGVGFSKEKVGGVSGDTNINFVAGVPIVLVGADDVNFMFRPSILYATKPGGGVDNAFAVRADLAVELWVTSHASVLAGTGVQYVSESPIATGVEKTTSFSSRAISATEVGFYYYFAK